VPGTAFEIWDILGRGAGVTPAPAPSKQMGSRGRLVGLLLLSAIVWPGGRLGAARDGAGADQPFSHYRPTLRVPDAMAPFLSHLPPGDDAFPEEKEAAELAARLEELGRRLRRNPRAADTATFLLGPEFEGGRLRPVDVEAVVDHPALRVLRAKAMAPGLVRSARSFGQEILDLTSDLETVEVAEFPITTIDVNRATGLARTEVRYDIVGRGRSAWRVQCVGRWSMRWRRGADGAWRVVEWTASDQQSSRASAPIFTEMTTAALG
jgi:hypothetical protein